MRHVYFPTTAVVALLYAMDNGVSAEIAIVGNEGIVGISLFMGGQSTPSRAVVQCADALIAQMMLTAACNRHHSSEEQRCRWLLLSLDYLGVNELETTQTQIANMLDARRDHLTAYSQEFRRTESSRYPRGHVTLLDRELLERRSCECYAVIKKEYARLLPSTPAT